MPCSPDRPTSPQWQHVVAATPPLHYWLLPLALLEALDVGSADCVCTCIGRHGPETDNVSLVNLVLQEPLSIPRAE